MLVYERYLRVCQLESHRCLTSGRVQKVPTPAPILDAKWNERRRNNKVEGMRIREVIVEGKKKKGRKRISKEKE